VSDERREGEESRLARDRLWAGWALSRWESFPVGQQPRPLVMTGPLTRFERGFRSGPAKLAFLHGDIEAAVPLPDGLLQMLRSGANRPRPVPGRMRWQHPLLITQASPGTAEFGTDRGRRKFTAWRLGGPDVDGTFWAVDPAVAARRWEPPEPAPPKPFDGLPHRSGSAVIEGDGRTLHFTFVGGPPAFFDYPSAEVIETGQAIVVLPAGRYTGPPGWVAAPGCGRTVTVILASPLGQRVVIDLDASPVTVHPAAPVDHAAGADQVAAPPADRIESRAE
jgi:hypothetical protein